MGRRRFYAPRGAFAEGGKLVRLGPDEARHLRDVLRLKQGDEVFVFDGAGREYRCRIEAQGRESAELEVREEVAPASPESPLALTLAVALLKGEKFDLVVQKATELGVARVVPVMTKLADVRLKNEAEAGKRTARWQRIALEAAKQSGRARVPEIHSPRTFDSVVSDSVVEDGSGRALAEETDAPVSSLEGLRLLFSERDGEGLLETIEGWPKGPHSGFTALVGSEGGWTDEELAQARRAGWHIVTLGGRILRAETAAITIAALLQHLLGDLK